MKVYEVYYDMHNHGSYEDEEHEFGQMVSVHKTKEGALKKIENISKEENLKTFINTTDYCGNKYILTTINVNDYDYAPEELLNEIRNAKTYEETENDIDYDINDMNVITKNYSIYEVELED